MQSSGGLAKFYSDVNLLIDWLRRNAFLAGGAGKMCRYTLVDEYMTHHW